MSRRDSDEVDRISLDAAAAIHALKDEVGMVTQVVLAYTYVTEDGVGQGIYFTYTGAAMGAIGMLETTKAHLVNDQLQLPNLEDDDD